MNEFQKGYPRVGRINRNRWLEKTVHVGNVLRKPEPSFTIAASLWDENSAMVKGIRIFYRGQVYELERDEFNRLKHTYDYGNGRNYRVAVTLWKHVVQTEMVL